MTPFEQGEQAFLEGKKLTQNPWPAGPKRVQWSNGWNSERNKHQQPLEITKAVPSNNAVTYCFNRSLTDAEVDQISALILEHVNGN